MGHGKVAIRSKQVSGNLNSYVIKYNYIYK